MEGWGAWIDTRYPGGNQGPGLYVRIMVDGQLVADISGDFVGYIGFISSDPFTRVTMQMGGECCQETFDVDNMAVIPWCSPRGPRGIHGDPHVKTWSGDYFDYMGACDLVMVNSAEKDLDLHVRTKIRYDYSFIESAALRIGDDILEVGSFGDHALNGVDSAFAMGGSAGYQLGPYPVHYTENSKQKHTFDVVLTPYLNATFVVYKDIVNVLINGDGSKAFFEGTMGLMGAIDGTLLARDGNTNMGVDYNAFGQEWQVRGDEPLLFRSARAPQYPDHCELPTADSSEQRRRLGEGGVSKEAAEIVCKKYAGASKDLHAFENCVADVLAFNDLGFAEAGSF
jgi:hypothetical protein